MKSMLRLMRDLFQNVFYLLNGLIQYKRTGVTSQNAHLAMVRLFCLTGGLSNSFFSTLISLKKRKRNVLKNVQGVLGNLNIEKMNHIVSTLKKEGYIIFEEKLSVDTVNELLMFSLKQEAKILYERKGMGPDYGVYDRKNFQGLCYDIPSSKSLTHPKIQSLLQDESFLSVAEAYLGCEPWVEPINLRWSTSLNRSPNDEAAQRFHFDMERFKWIKFFIYLTDVKEENGPHVFIKGSHRNNGIPWKLRQRGYVRISDEEIRKIYSEKDIVKITAPAGTVFAVDTRGFHKGMEVKSEDRLMLQLQYSNSLFGAIG